jgi:AcrR family transcriptional regulator
METIIEKKQSTKDFIISKAAELFNQYGYNGCSMNNIMEATGLKKGGIYNHFSSKDEIALEAFNYSYTEVIKRFRSNLDIVDTASEKLYAIIDTYVSLMDSPIMKGGCPMFNTAVDAVDVNPNLASRAKDGIARLQRYIEIKIEQGIASGEFNKDCDPVQISSLMIINLEGAIIMSRVSDDKYHMVNTVAFLKQYILANVIL